MSYQTFSTVYDVLTMNVDYQKINDRICSLLHENGVDGGLLLDLACGTGTISNLLFENGYDVIGVDKSPDMLAVAQGKSTGSILFLCQDMCRLDLFGTVKACVCTLDSINHLKDFNEVKKVFERVALFIEENGIFIFDVNTVFKHREILGNNTFVYDTDDVFCVWQNETRNNTTEMSLSFFKQRGNLYERNDEFLCEKAYETDKIKSALTEAGFETMNIFDGYSASLLSETSERALFVCKRMKK